MSYFQDNHLFMDIILMLQGTLCGYDANALTAPITL